MIMMTPKDMDSAFVAKAMQEHHLNPIPKTGFHAEATYWQETERWKRVIERYEWGAVLFLSDRTRGAHATVVAVGKIDIEAGKVTTQGGWTDIKPDWYKEMAMELRDAKRAHTATLQVPPCLGFRQADHVCDGGINPDNKKMEPACAWRDRCMSLQDFALEQGKNQEDLLKSKSPEQIVQLTTRLLERKGQKPKAAPVANKQQPKAPSEATAGTPSNVAATPSTSKVTMSLVSGIANEVAAAAGIKVSPDFGKASAGAGDLYLVDRTANSDYISLYQSRRPRPLALASFRLRSRVGMLVQLPIEKDSQLLAGIVESDIKEWKDGAFKCAVREVPMEGTRLEHVKHVLVGIIQANKG